MKKRRLLVSLVAGFLALIMLLSLVVSLIPVPASAASSSEIQEQIEELQSEQAEIEAKIEELNSQKEANYEEIKSIVAEKKNIFFCFIKIKISYIPLSSGKAKCAGIWASSGRFNVCDPSL